MRVGRRVGKERPMKSMMARWGGMVVAGLAAPVAAAPLAVATVAVCAVEFMWRAQPGDGFEDADALLTALESADSDLRRLAARVRYTRTFDLAGDRQIRDGHLYFISDPSPVVTEYPIPNQAGTKSQRKFVIDFTRLIVGRRQEDSRQTFIFDGEWLIEKQHAARHAIRRQVAPPGSTFDPLRIGEGPMPIPIGQPKREILSRYEARLVGADDGLWLDPAQPWTTQEEDEAKALREFAKDSWQLLLTPLPERAEEDDFTQIRLWYKRERDGRLLPRMARTINRAGDVSVVQLFSLAVNAAAKIPSDALSTEIPAGWNVDVLSWRGEDVKESEGDANVRR